MKKMDIYSYKFIYIYIQRELMGDPVAISSMACWKIHHVFPKLRLLGDLWNIGGMIYGILMKNIIQHMRIIYHNYNPLLSLHYCKSIVGINENDIMGINGIPIC